MSEPLAYTVAQVASLTGRGPEAIRRAIERGDLAASKPRGSSMWAITPAAVRRWLSSDDGEATDVGRGQRVPAGERRGVDRAGVDGSERASAVREPKRPDKGRGRAKAGRPAQRQWAIDSETDVSWGLPRAVGE